MNCRTSNKPLQIKRGTARALYKVNPILLEGQPCMETDTCLMKIGNGFTRYNSLPYIGEAFKGVNGKSAYELWKEQGFEGTVNDFLDSLVGEHGESAYEIWLSLGNEGNIADFIASLEGARGYSAYEVWLNEGNEGTVADYLDSLKGKSAYQIWLDLGNEGTEVDFIEYLRGDSAYDIWLEEGNEGTKQDFLDSLKGKDGENGKSAYEVFKETTENPDMTEQEYIASITTMSWSTF